MRLHKFEAIVKQFAHERHGANDLPVDTKILISCGSEILEPLEGIAYDPLHETLILSIHGKKRKG